MTKSFFFGIDRPYVFSYRSKIYNGITRVYNVEGVKELKYLLTYRNSKLSRELISILLDPLRLFYFQTRINTGFHMLWKKWNFFFFTFTALSKTCRKLNHLY